MANKRMVLRVAPLPRFRLTEAEIAKALNTPVEKRTRIGEIVIAPEGGRPRSANRLISYAYDVYMADNPVAFATLMRSLFINYVLGNLVMVGEGQQVVTTVQDIPTFEEYDDDELFFDVDTSKPLPDYEFKEIS